MSSLNGPPASHAIIDSLTGVVVCETFEPIDRLNTDRYKAVPIQKYLGCFNVAVKENGGNQPPDTFTE